MSIRLSDLEQQVCRLLLRAADHIRSSGPDTRPLILRIAGGWVRDKLLGKESDDIDIAIDTMKGEPFAQHLKSFAEAEGMHMSTIATIQVNPEKSKHLETARASILGLDIDFAHLRTEIYNHVSRNPEVAFGTPEEDAMRRDITINSLFYNINSGLVEDFTGMGLQDLRNGTVRTPLEPLQTFIDDPLRVLRVVRFATRFGYQVVPAIMSAAKDDRIRDAFNQKITRERIGVELDKILRGPDPVRAIELLIDFGFHPLVFALPPDVSWDKFGPTTETIVSARILDMLISQQKLQEMGFRSFLLSTEDRRNLFMATSLLIVGDAKFKQKAREVMIARHVVLLSIKWSNTDADVCAALLGHLKQIHEMALRHSETEEGLDRMTLGMLVRDLGARPLGSKWDLAVLMALVQNLTSIATSLSDPTAFTLDDPKAQKIMQVYTKLLHTITSHQLEDAHEIKPLMDGKEIAALLKVKPGPHIGRYLHHVMEWQLTHTHATKTQCIEYLQARFGEKTTVGNAGDQQR